jgi:hypothetical protein
MTHAALPRWAHREQGSGYISVALHRAFICRHNVHDRAPRTGRWSLAGVLGVGDISDESQLLTDTTWLWGADRVSIEIRSRFIECVGKQGRVKPKLGGEEAPTLYITEAQTSFLPGDHCSLAPLTFSLLHFVIDSVTAYIIENSGLFETHVSQCALRPALFH